MPVLQLREQRKHLRLSRDIQRRGRFVGDEQPRTAHQRHRDHGALAQPAGQLPRVLVHDVLGIRHPYIAQLLDCALRRLRLAEVEVQAHGLDDLIADRMDRTEGGHRFLKNETDVAAAKFAHLRAVSVETQQVERVLAPPQHDTAAQSAGSLVLDSHDGLRRHALAATAFTDHTKRPPGQHVETDAVHCADASFDRVEIHGQITDLNNRVRIQAVIFRRPSHPDPPHPEGRPRGS